jgi:filamentous hemagglutinin
MTSSGNLSSGPISAASATLSSGGTLLANGLIATSGNVGLTSSGDLTAGAITGSAGGISLSSGGNLTLTDNVSAAAGALTFSTGSAGSLSLAANTTASGKTVSVTSGNVNVNGTLAATAGGAAFQSNAANGSLTVSIASGATLSAAGNVSFTASGGGLVVSGGSGNGQLLGSSINLNGGGGSVSMNMNNETGTVSANGSTINVSLGSGDLSIGTVTATGNVSLSSTAGNLNLSDVINIVGGALSATTSSSGAIAQSAAKTVSADSINLVSGLITVGGSVAANVGNLSLQSNQAGSTLTVNVNQGASLVAAGTASGILFNSTSSGAISASGSGSISSTGAVSFNGGQGAVSVNVGSLSGSVNANASSISISTASGGLVVSSAAASNGSVTLTSTGQLNVASGATIFATEGNVTLLNTDSAAGSIQIGHGATLSATTAGTTLGRVYIAIGSVPPSPAQGSAANNVTVNLTNGGAVFWGTNGITADSPASAVNVDGGQVVFSTGNLSGNAIHLNSQVTINSHAINPAPPPPPPPLLITSLDFTNPQTVSLLVSLQQHGEIGGTLKVQNGIAVGGNAIIDSAMLSPTITAENLPAHVTLTLKDFQTSTPINIALSHTSTTQQVVINGTEQFIGTVNSSNALITISQSPLDNALVFGKGSLLASDGGLSLSVAGNVAMNGSITASSLLLQTTAHDGNIALHGNITATNSVALSAHGAGNITRQSGTLTAPTVSLVSGTGNIGAQGARIDTAAQTLSANTSGSGNVYISQAGDVNLLSSSAGNQFRLRTSGRITVSGAVSADKVVLRSASPTGSINLSANLNALDFARVITNGSGSITQSAGTISADTLELISNSGAIGSALNPIQLASSDLKATTGGSSDVFLSAVGSVSLHNSCAGGQFSLRATGGIEARDITTGNGSISLTAGSGTLSIDQNSRLYANEGNIILRNTNTSSGAIELGKNSTVWAYTVSNPQLGNVTLSIGPIPTNPVAGARPAKLTVEKTDGGQVYYGVNSISVLKNGNTVLAEGRNVVFNTGSRPATAIQLDGNVTIIADPPAVSTAPSSVVSIPATLDSSQVQPLSYAAAVGAPLKNINNSNPVDTLPLSSTHSRIMDDAGAPQAQPARTDADYEPIAYVRSSPSVLQTQGGTYENGLSIRHDGTARLIESDDRVITLNQGEVLITTSRQTVLNLGAFNISIAKGTIALLSSNSSLITIRNLYESNPQSLMVLLSNKSSVMLAAGQELILGADRQKIAEALRNDGIGRRRAQITAASDGTIMARSEISLTSLLQGNTLLHTLSRGNMQDRAIASKLFKMAACLMVTTQSHGGYSNFDK